MTYVERPRDVEAMLKEMRSMLTRALSVNEEYDRLLVAVTEERDRYKARVVELAWQVADLQKRAEEAEVGRALAVDDRLDILRASGELKERMREIEARFR